MRKPEAEDDPAGKFIPATVRKRMYVLNDIVEELNKRKFRNLDETNPTDLKSIISIVQDMHPESNYYKCREYSIVAIRIWKKNRKK
ncbi:MAG: hypothetical protein JRN51_07335 [Nitrososphaerota archaeon]|jgi:hypothetical protein|nr:hypothetical protein [Ferrimicrobium acidiphilum]MDG6912920.1 hypothetical protein [Nitrososphaerota archaeon]MDG6980912.1 hypothetical protein [Nitrososphaerota archaeon]